VVGSPLVLMLARPVAAQERQPRPGRAASGPGVEAALRGFR
jgi:hypothetical protein